MKKIVLNEIEYELIIDYKEGFDHEEVKKKATEYFNDFDYIFGDWSYGKLRLKGYCDKGNPLFREINDIEGKDKYILNNCSFDCRYFLLKKVK